GPLRDYMNEFAGWRALGFLFYTPTVVMNSYWSGVANTRVLAYGTLITSGFTIVLDYLLIFGHAGLPALGVEGAAIATIAAECIAMLFILIYSVRFAYASGAFDDRKSFNQRVFQWSRSHTWSMTKLGFPISLQLLASLGIWIVFYGFIEDMGEQDLQSAFIVRNMYMLCYVSVGGISTATKTYISALIAEGRQGELHRTMFRLMALNFAGIACLSHGLWLYPEWIASQFSSDAGVIHRTVDSMLVVLPAMLGFSLTGVMLATVEGCGATMKGFVIEASTGIIYILAAYWMVHEAHWPIHWVWASDYVYFFFLGVFSLIFLFNGRWKYRKI
ncbi:MAG: MATE family efflux transporter, partial [Flavobacteriales bacterium]